MSEPLIEVSHAIGAFDGAVADLRAVRDTLATALYRFEIQELGRWLVPPSHRPTCPLDNQPCTSWTCLVDVCVDEKKPQGALEDSDG